MKAGFLAFLDRLEHRARVWAIGLTVLIAAVALAWPAMVRLLVELEQRISEQMDTPDVVIRPGYKVMIDGHAVPVFGFDHCPDDPRPWKAFWLGGRPDDDQIPKMWACIVVSPQTTSIHVRFPSDSGVKQEIWTIKHSRTAELTADATSSPYGDLSAIQVIRPNGQLVTAPE